MGLLGDLRESYFGNVEVTRLSMARCRGMRARASAKPSLCSRAPRADARRAGCARAQGLARSFALFAGSVVLMRQFGDLMAV